MGENAKNVEIQGDNTGNLKYSVGNLSIVVETTKTSNGNDKLKEWGKAKIIENQHIYKTSIPHIWSLSC